MATAGVTHDIVLDGVGYMLAAAKEAYLCAAEGPRAPGLGESGEVYGASGSDALAGRRRLVFEGWRGLGNPVSGGKEPLSQGQPAKLEGIRPVAGGALAMLAPAERSFSVAGTHASPRAVSAYYSGVTYFSINNKLFKLTADGNQLCTGFVDTGLSFTFAITDLCVHNELLFIAEGSTKIHTYNGTTLTDVTATYGAGLYLASYAGMLFWKTSAGTLNWRIPATSTNYNQILGTNITSLTVGGGSLWVGGESGLWRVTGHLKAGNPYDAPGVLNLFEPEIAQVLAVAPFRPNFYPTSYNFFRLVAAHGYLWFPLNGRLCRMRFSDSLGAGQGVLEPQPLFGKSRGLGLCDGLVVWVCESGDRRYVWCWEPEGGWWLLGKGIFSSQNYGQPFSGYPGCKDAAVCVTTWDQFRVSRWPFDGSYQVGRNPNLFGLSDLSNTGYVYLPLFGPDDLAKAGGENGNGTVARLLAIGLEWGTPGEPADWFDPSPYLPGGGSAGAVSFEVELSTNGGMSWSGLGSYAPPTVEEFRNGRKRWTLSEVQGEAVTTGGSQPARYQFRVRVSGPHAPALSRIWLDYRLERLRQESGREWRLKLALLDPAVTLNLQGQAGNNNGGWGSVAAGVAALRDLWNMGSTVDFYDLDGSGPYRVKLASFRATRAGEGWEAAARLVEVQE
jgi:hypothetical protein